MTFLGKNIRLKGKTQKGKNRVREHGDEWVVLAVTDTVLFQPSKKGPWLFLSPLGKNQDDKASRWVKLEDDHDFEIKL